MSDKADRVDPGLTGSSSTLLVVLGDFGREAGLRFCHEFAKRERSRLLAELPEGDAFFDECRTATLALVGDLPFVKEPVLRRAGSRTKSHVYTSTESNLPAATQDTAR